MAYQFLYRDYKSLEFISQAKNIEEAISDFIEQNFDIASLDEEVEIVNTDGTKTTERKTINILENSQLKHYI